MIQKGDLVLHKTLGYAVKRKSLSRGQVQYPGSGLPTCPLLGLVVSVYHNDEFPIDHVAHELVKVMWLGGVKAISSYRIIPTGNLVLHKNLTKEVIMIHDI